MSGHYFGWKEVNCDGITVINSGLYVPRNFFVLNFLDSNQKFGVTKVDELRTFKQRWDEGLVYMLGLREDIGIDDLYDSCPVNISCRTIADFERILRCGNYHPHSAGEFALDVYYEVSNIIGS